MFYPKFKRTEPPGYALRRCLCCLLSADAAAVSGGQLLNVPVFCLSVSCFACLGYTFVSCLCLI